MRLAATSGLLPRVAASGNAFFCALWRPAGASFARHGDQRGRLPRLTAVGGDPQPRFETIGGIFGRASRRLPVASSKASSRASSAPRGIQRGLLPCLAATNGSFFCPSLRPVRASAVTCGIRRWLQPHGQRGLRPRRAAGLLRASRRPARASSGFACASWRRAGALWRLALASAEPRGDRRGLRPRNRRGGFSGGGQRFFCCAFFWRAALLLLRIAASSEDSFCALWQLAGLRVFPRGGRRWLRPCDQQRLWPRQAAGALAKSRGKQGGLRPRLAASSGGASTAPCGDRWGLLPRLTGIKWGLRPRSAGALTAPRGDQRELRPRLAATSGGFGRPSRWPVGASSAPRGDQRWLRLCLAAIGGCVGLRGDQQWLWPCLMGLAGTSAARSAWALAAASSRDSPSSLRRTVGVPSVPCGDQRELQPQQAAALLPCLAAYNGGSFRTSRRPAGASAAPRGDRRGLLLRLVAIGGGSGCTVSGGIFCTQWRPAGLLLCLTETSGGFFRWLPPFSVQQRRGCPWPSSVPHQGVVCRVW